MDDDSDAANWVLVNEVDCTEDTLSLKPTHPTVTDSDQDSDGSISIISEHPTDSYSEEEHEHIPVVVKETDPTASPLVLEEESQVQTPEVNSSHIKADMLQDLTESTQETSNGDITSTSESSSSCKQWAYVDEKSKLDLDPSNKIFYLDCSQEPVLEMTPTETEADTESTTSNKECQIIVKKHINVMSHIPNREPNKDGTFNKIGIGILISMMVLIGSHLIQQYSEYQDDKIQSSSESFLEGLPDSEKVREVVAFCTDRQKSKGEYSEHVVEKCVLKRLRKKNREEAMRKTEIYLQMKERILELREQELAEKEKKILHKWRKKGYSHEHEGMYYKKKDNYGSEQRKRKGNAQHFVESDKKYRELPDFKSRKKRDSKEDAFKKEGKGYKGKNKSHSFRAKPSQNSQEFRPRYKKDDNTFKKIKNFQKTKEDKLKILTENIKSLEKNPIKPNLKTFKGDRKEDPNEEWYIKYNPAKNTIELINITTLPERDSLLIKNGNKTINGQWYFSLYGISRANIRNKEKEAEWYFKRGHFRENRRDKAKWYFDYMSARDNTRYLY